MKRILIFAFLLFGVAVAANATVNDGRVVTTVGYVTHEMGTLQNEIPSQTGTKAMTFGDDAGEISARDVVSTLGTSTSDTSLPMVSAVNDKLDDKQDTIPAKNTNTVLAYTGVEGSVGEKGIYQNSGSYAGQMDNLVTAGTFNAALKNGLDNEFVCAETDPATGQCWAYSINNNGGPWNYFNMDDIPERSVNNAGTVARNADGSITIDGGPSSSAVSMYRTLGQLAPGLEVGKSYKYSIKTTSSTKIMLLYKSGNNITWSNNTVKTITAEMLNRPVYFYTNGANTTATISSIKITAVDSGAAVGATGTIVPNGYIPVKYVQNAANTYINTGVTPDQDDVEMEIRYYCNTTSSNYIFQSRATSEGSLYGFTGSQTGATLNGTWVSGARSAITRTVGHIYKTNLKVHNGKLTFTVTDETTGQTDVQTRNITFTAPEAPMGIFGNTGGNRIADGHRVYYAWIKVNGQYVMNYIPVTYNGAKGFYDTVSQSFKGATAGSLSAGPELNNSLYIPQNQ